MVLDDPNQLEIKLKRNLNCQQCTVRAALHRDKHTEGMIFSITLDAEQNILACRRVGDVT